IAIPWVTAGAHILSLGQPSRPDAATAVAGSEAVLGHGCEGCRVLRPGCEGCRVLRHGCEGCRASGAGGEDDGWDRRHLQIGMLTCEAADPAPEANDSLPPAPAAVTAVARLALALSLRCREPVPELRLAGSRHPIALWLCGAHAGSWLGVALIDVDTLAPGSYPLELRLRGQPPFRRRLERLASPGGFRQ
ncbi:MAG TPA: hypothetical protein VE075_06785, partial [Thermoanaerobaculia bacterium]|nr:hypothetical protein [Thermoanaerobaculia bacterium]